MSGRVYDADIYAFSRAPEHYWAATAGPADGSANRRLDGDITADVAVIGGGYTGLSAAHRLANRHGASVCVLEAGACIGWGASGANGGFVSMGGAKLAIGEMLRRVGEAETKRYWTTQVAAVEDLCAFIADHRIECDAVGDGNLCVAHHPSVAPALAEQAETLSQHFGVAADFIDAARFRREVHDGPEAHGALCLRPGFAIHPLRLARGLARAAETSGAAIFTHAEVLDWRHEGNVHCLTTAAGACIRAGCVVMATNGYTPNGLRPGIGFRGFPAISNIIVTQAYGDHELDRRGFRSMTPIYNSRGLLFYYRRLPGGRILFGRRGDTRGTAAAARAQATRTRESLARVLPDFSDARIESAWRGLVCATVRRTLALGLDPDDPSVAFAFGCQGSGTATMSWAGRLAADLVLGAASESDVPALFRGLPARLLPSNAALRWGLRTAYGYFGLRDALHV